MCQDNVLLVVGDFNARVGSNQVDSNNVEWSGVRGIYGVGNVNEVGRAFLTFCTVNDLTVMNTWHDTHTHAHTHTHKHLDLSTCSQQNDASHGVEPPVACVVK